MIVTLSLLLGLCPFSPIEVEILVELIFLELDWIRPLLKNKVLGAFLKPICSTKSCGFVSWLLDFVFGFDTIFSLLMVSIFSAPIEVGSYSIEVERRFVGREANIKCFMFDVFILLVLEAIPKPN